MNPRLMLDALKQRKDQGLDITILLAPQGEEMKSEEDEAKELDMAPPAEELGEGQDMADEAKAQMGQDMQVLPDNSTIPHGDEMQDKALIQEELKKLGRSGLMKRK